MRKLNKKNRNKSHPPRTRLRLPDLDQAKSAVLLSLADEEQAIEMLDEMANAEGLPLYPISPVMSALKQEFEMHRMKATQGNAPA